MLKQLNDFSFQSRSIFFNAFGWWAVSYGHIMKFLPKCLKAIILMVLIAALYESVQDAELRARGTIPLRIKNKSEECEKINNFEKLGTSPPFAKVCKKNVGQSAQR